MNDGKVNILESEIPPVLEHCCRVNSSAVISLPGQLTSALARFARYAPDAVALEIPDTDSSFSKNAACVVSVQIKGRTCVFLSTVRAFRKKAPGRFAEIEVNVPSSIFVAEMRRWFRTSIVEGSKLVAVIARNGVALSQAIVVDISIGGMKIAFRPGNDPDLPVGNFVEIELSIDGNGLECNAEVRLRDGQSYGLMFSLSDAKTEETLGHIVRAVEREWLKSRVETA